MMQHDTRMSVTDESRIKMELSENQVHERLYALYPELGFFFRKVQREMDQVEELERRLELVEV